METAAQGNHNHQRLLPVVKRLILFFLWVDEEGCVLQPHSPIFEVRFELMHDVLESLVRTDR